MGLSAVCDCGITKSYSLTFLEQNLNEYSKYDYVCFPTLYWLPKLHKRPCKSRCIANSSACTTTELSILRLLASLRFKTMSLNIALQFLKEMVKNYFVLKSR